MSAGVCVCVCDPESVCHLHYFFSFLVILEDILACRHISTPHWNAMILCLFRQPCGDWANIDSRYQSAWCSAWSESTHIKMDELWSVFWGVYFNQIHVDWTFHTAQHAQNVICSVFSLFFLSLFHAKLLLLGFFRWGYSHDEYIFYWISVFS